MYCFREHFSGYDIPERKDRNSDGGGIIMYYKTHVKVIIFDVYIYVKMSKNRFMKKFYANF
jgi:hypothetical protein